MKLLDSLPPEKLTPEEENDLATRIQKAQDEDDINRLVLHNMREGFLYAKKVCRARIPDDELFSLCYTSLRRNAKRFQPNRIRFFSFAKIDIRGIISRYWRSLDTVKNSSMHEDPDTVFLPTVKKSNPDSSDSPDDTEDWEIKFTDPKIVSQKDEPSVDPDFKSIETREQMKFVNTAIESRLTEQERMVLDLHYKNGFSFQEIGDLLEITRSAVLLAHTKAIQKIRVDMVRQRRALLR